MWKYLGLLLVLASGALCCKSNPEPDNSAASTVSPTFPSRLYNCALDLEVNQSPTTVANVKVYRLNATANETNEMLCAARLKAEGDPFTNSSVYENITTCNYLGNETCPACRNNSDFAHTNENNVTVTCMKDVTTVVYTTDAASTTADPGGAGENDGVSEDNTITYALVGAGGALLIVIVATVAWKCQQRKSDKDLPLDDTMSSKSDLNGNAEVKRITGGGDLYTVVDIKREKKNENKEDERKEIPNVLYTAVDPKTGKNSESLTVDNVLYVAGKGDEISSEVYKM